MNYYAYSAYKETEALQGCVLCAASHSCQGQDSNLGLTARLFNSNTPLCLLLLGDHDSISFLQ